MSPGDAVEGETREGAVGPAHFDAGRVGGIVGDFQGKLVG